MYRDTYLNCSCDQYTNVAKQSIRIMKKDQEHLFGKDWCCGRAYSSTAFDGLSLRVSSGTSICEASCQCAQEYSSRYPKCLEFCHLCGRFKWSSHVLASSSPDPANASTQTQQMKITLFFLSVSIYACISLPHCHFAFQINKHFKRTKFKLLS